MNALVGPFDLLMRLGIAVGGLNAVESASLSAWAEMPMLRVTHCHPHFAPYTQSLLPFVVTVMVPSIDVLKS